jgi:hypothetical protein
VDVAHGTKRPVREAGDRAAEAKATSHWLLVHMVRPPSGLTVRPAPYLMRALLASALYAAVGIPPSISFCREHIRAQLSRPNFISHYR